MLKFSQEAIQRGYEAEASGHGERAAKLYSTALDSCREALQVNCYSSGLGPKADTVSSWRHDLEAWIGTLVSRLDDIRHSRTFAAPPTNPLKVKPSSNASKASKTPAAHTSVKASPLYTKGLVYEGRKEGAGRTSNGGSSTKPCSEADKYHEAVCSEIIDGTRGGVKWQDIAGLEVAKQALTEAVILPSIRLDLFQGLRAPVKGILLYGPPGNGKTFLARALANESNCTFFSISASSLTSKFLGDGEKLVRAMFQVAAEKAPSIIFMDEIDSMLSSRGGGNEHDAMRRLKTEFLVQFDGCNTSDSRIIVIGATNRPQDLDEAVLRRLVKRIYIPLPDGPGRRSILISLLQRSREGSGSRASSSLSPVDIERIVNATASYSASDLTALCKEAAMNPVREKLKGRSMEAISAIDINAIRPINLQDFSVALGVIKPQTISLDAYEKFTSQSGSRG